MKCCKLIEEIYYNHVIYNIYSTEIMFIIFDDQGEPNPLILKYI
jgi:hypothetical protein